VNVRDNGLGLSAEMLPHVFDLFTQVGASLHRSTGGLGIGLTLAKKLVELHGGSLQAESQGIGHGSEFTVRVPMSKSPVPEAPTPAAESVNVVFDKSRILIVEDNADTARGIAKRLELLGNEVGTVHDGPSALQAAREQRFDFILLDIGLPGLSGYEVASELRKEGCCKESVIIAVTGYGQEEDRLRSREAGIDHHLVKPIEHNALLTLLSQYQ
jgi:CheY-like chemotaxis protein